MNNHFILYLFHMLLVSPLLIYIWYMSNIRVQVLDSTVGSLLLISGLIIFFYHLYRLIQILRQ